jgi:ATP-dependent DNA ligase
MTRIVRTQPTLANRKLPEFLRCPVCGVDFRRAAPSQRWCSLECWRRGKRSAGDTPRRIADASAAPPMLPRVQPIAPVRRAEPFDDPTWLFDLKYDGFRALCYLEQGGCRLISRNGNPMHRFDCLGDQIAASLDVSDAILDGEVIAADETGRPQFYDLLRDTRAPAYVAFDVIWLNGTDLRPLPLTERRQHLQNILPDRSAVISEALSVRGSGHKLFELTCDHDLEGIVAKRLKDGYGSRIRWLKIKNPGYSQSEGRRELFDRSAGTHAGRLEPLTGIDEVGGRPGRRIVLGDG